VINNAIRPRGTSPVLERFVGAFGDTAGHLEVLATQFRPGQTVCQFPPEQVEIGGTAALELAQTPLPSPHRDGSATGGLIGTTGPRQLRGVEARAGWSMVDLQHPHASWGASGDSVGLRGRFSGDRDVLSRLRQSNCQASKRSRL